MIFDVAEKQRGDGMEAVGLKGGAGAVGPRGFTLIELLVVIGIIIVLVGLLLGALGHAKKKAQEVATRALMTDLSQDIQAYYHDFSAYPGPMPKEITTTSNAANKVSGTQNMLLGLTYAMYASQPPNGAAIPGTSPVVYTDLTRTTGPIDYGSIGPDGKAKQHQAYYSPTQNQLTTLNTVPTFPMPLVVDKYPDGLPILYYRRSPGVEQSTLNNGKVVETDPGTAIAPYYYNENMEYTNATIAATSGSSFVQTLQPTDLETLVKQGGPFPATPVSARGGFILLSAGSDRTYVSGVKNNDAIVAGD